MDNGEMLPGDRESTRPNPLPSSPPPARPPAPSSRAAAGGGRRSLGAPRPRLDHEALGEHLAVVHPADEAPPPPRESGDAEPAARGGGGASSAGWTTARCSP